MRAFKALPFVGEQTFWSVEETGDWSEDNAIGREYGRQVVDTMQALDAPILLGRVIESMVERGKYGGIEVGFLAYIGAAAATAAR